MPGAGSPTVEGDRPRAPGELPYQSALIHRRSEFLVDLGDHGARPIVPDPRLPEHLATTKTVRRPPLFFRKDGEMPETLELTFHKPELFSHLSDETYRAWIARMVATREAHRRRQREEKGRKVLGRRAVLDRHHEDQPSSHEANFQPNPRVGAADPWRRIEAIQRLVGFLKQHAASWLRWRAGERDVVFPFGTYAMRVYHGAACAQAPPAPA